MFETEIAWGSWYCSIIVDWLNWGLSSESAGRKNNHEKVKANVAKTEKVAPILEKYKNVR